jgi:ferredoxin, 2Fe-2S
MPLITWKLPDGTHRTLDVAEGDNLMLAATLDNIPGIDGDCGGCLSCATCHVVVAPEWIARVGTPAAAEDGMLDSTPALRQPHSRLSCQIVARADLDGLTVTVPAP